MVHAGRYNQNRLRPEVSQSLGTMVAAAAINLFDRITFAEQRDRARQRRWKRSPEYVAAATDLAGEHAFLDSLKSPAIDENTMPEQPQARVAYTRTLSGILRPLEVAMADDYESLRDASIARIAAGDKMGWPEGVPRTAFADQIDPLQESANTVGAENIRKNPIARPGLTPEQRQIFFTEMDLSSFNPETEAPRGVYDTYLSREPRTISEKGRHI